MNAGVQTRLELQSLLRHDGYHFLSARSAAEGSGMLALHQVKVILCDRRMPDMSGAVLVGGVKDLYADTFRVVVTAIYVSHRTDRGSEWVETSPRKGSPVVLPRSNPGEYAYRRVEAGTPRKVTGPVPVLFD